MRKSWRPHGSSNHNTRDHHALSITRALSLFLKRQVVGGPVGVMDLSGEAALALRLSWLFRAIEAKYPASVCVVQVRRQVVLG